MNKIKAIRQARGLAQVELARMVGVSQPFIHDLENGHRNAQPATMQKIAEVLGCTVEELRGADDGTAS